MTLSQLNSLSRDEFVRVVGPVFERSPWIAEAGWAERPFENLDELHAVLCAIVRQADGTQQVQLIQAHPDLVGRAALAGTLTTESTREQASAGLDRLTAEEVAAFQRFNDQYRNKFGFPFVICARLNKKDAILTGFRSRLNNSREQEIGTALL
ncbi:MAG TPA: 2-oxo-4-hydroxy-4-carboxy-5-ureidoimidazoline decarboxylase, partial [Verrucomicrobiae bacterium]